MAIISYVQLPLTHQNIFFMLIIELLFVPVFLSCVFESVNLWQLVFVIFFQVSSPCDSDCKRLNVKLFLLMFSFSASTHCDLPD